MLFGLAQQLTLVLKKKVIITVQEKILWPFIPNHPITLELLKQLNFHLAAPSTNPFNRISTTTAKHVEDYFKIILDGGASKSGIESTIIGFENDAPIIYRLGSTPMKL